MKTVSIAAAAAAAVIVIGAGTYMIDVEQTEEATLPEVSVEGGNMPEFEAEVGSVSVGETTVTVPTIDIQTPDETADLGRNTETTGSLYSTN